MATEKWDGLENISKKNILTAIIEMYGFCFNKSEILSNIGTNKKGYQRHIFEFLGNIAHICALNFF